MSFTSQQAMISSAQASAHPGSTMDFGLANHQDDELSEQIRETLRLHRSYVCRWLAENGVLVPSLFSADRPMTQPSK
jgi:hypothetical protein